MVEIVIIDNKPYLKMPKEELQDFYDRFCRRCPGHFVMPEQEYEDGSVRVSLFFFEWGKLGPKYALINYERILKILPIDLPREIHLTKPQ